MNHNKQTKKKMFIRCVNLELINDCAFPNTDFDWRRLERGVSDDKQHCSASNTRRWFEAATNVIIQALLSLLETNAQSTLLQTTFV